MRNERPESFVPHRAENGTQTRDPQLGANALSTELFPQFCGQ